MDSNVLIDSLLEILLSIDRCLIAEDENGAFKAVHKGLNEIKEYKEKA